MPPGLMGKLFYNFQNDMAVDVKLIWQNLSLRTVTATYVFVLTEALFKIFLISPARLSIFLSANPLSNANNCLSSMQVPHYFGRIYQSH
jgi:hypothetical protein